MKSVCFVAALVLLVAVPVTIVAADNGAALYKTKCASCHGPAGEGKPAMKMPALKGTSMTADQIVEYLTKGAAGKKAPHAKPVAGINAEQAKAVAETVKGLK